jgi:hypothetical protein
LETSEHICENASQEFVAGHLVDGSRFVPGERQRKRQGDANQEIGLPARVESVVGENIVEDVAERCADFLQPVWAAIETPVPSPRNWDMWVAPYFEI